MIAAGNGQGSKSPRQVFRVADEFAGEALPESSDSGSPKKSAGRSFRPLITWGGLVPGPAPVTAAALAGGLVGGLVGPLGRRKKSSRLPAINRTGDKMCVEAIIDDSAFRGQHMVWNWARLVCKPPAAGAAAVGSATNRGHPRTGHPIKAKHDLKHRVEDLKHRVTEATERKRRNSSGDRSGAKGFPGLTSSDLCVLRRSVFPTPYFPCLDVGGLVPGPQEQRKKSSRSRVSGGVKFGFRVALSLRERIAEPSQTSPRRAAGNQQMTSVTDSVSSRGARGLHWPTTAIDRKCHNVCVEAVIDDSAFRGQHMVWNRAELVCKPPSAGAAAVVSKPTTAATRVSWAADDFELGRAGWRTSFGWRRPGSLKADNRGHPRGKLGSAGKEWKNHGNLGNPRRIDSWMRRY